MNRGPAHEEIEVKLPVADVEAMREQLASIGARPVRERYFEDNRLYDFADRRLTRSGELLRLRRAGDRWVVTHKGPATGDVGPYKLRIETESPVEDGDALTLIFTRLGLEPVYRYQKYRTVYDCEGTSAELDETPVGNYLELEGSPAEIDRWAARLGFGTDDYIRESYRDLHQRRHRELGLPTDEMLF